MNDVKTDDMPVKRKAGRPKGSKNKNTNEIREAIAKAFHNVNRKGYLEDMAYKQPAAFMGLVAKVIPNEVKLDVSHNINLGDAMIQAAERLKALQHDDATLIDVTPEPASENEKPDKTKG